MGADLTAGRRAHTDLDNAAEWGRRPAYMACMHDHASPRLAAPAARALDPWLPGLAEALRPDIGDAATIGRSRVRHVAWTPRRHCEVVHEVRAGGQASTFVVFEVTPSATTVRRMVEDPQLPGLVAALDPATARHRLAEACGEPVLSCGVTPISYRPTRRAVLSYDVVTASGAHRVYAKLLADGVDSYAAAAAAITAAARARGTVGPVPTVLAVWPDLGAVVQRAAVGRGLSHVLGDDAVPVGGRAALATRLGRLLASVHQTPTGAEPVWTPPDELAQLEDLLASVWHAHPAAGRSFATLLDRLADRIQTGTENGTETGVDSDADLVFGHGAFRTGQVVADGDRLALLDLDGVCRSHPARDAGNALAYLSWAGLRGGLRRDLVPLLHQAFLDGYADARARLDPAAVRWWAAASMAKIAGRRYRSLATAEWPHVPELLDLAGAQLAQPAPTAGTRAQPRSEATVGPSAQRPTPDPLDCDGMTELLAAPLRPYALASRVRIVSARPLAQATGRRRVLRYLVEGLAAGCLTPVVGKVYADAHRSFVGYENLVVLQRDVFACTPGLCVPADLCRLPQLRMVLYKEAPGLSLSRLDPTLAVRAATWAARWLLTLHASPAVLTRRLDRANEEANVRAWAARVSAAEPELQAAATRLADRVCALADHLTWAAEVPIHKDLHPGHVLVASRPGHEGSLVTVVDLDEARMGDPALDVAHFCAYLDACRSPEAPVAAAMRAAFLAAYGPVPGPSPQRRLDFFTAHTALKMAKQIVNGTGPLAVQVGRARVDALAAVLARGDACLDG